MKTLYQPVFLLSLLLALGNQLLELQEIYMMPLHTHLDDLLALPLVLTIALTAERVYFRNPAFVLPLTFVVAAVVGFSLFFEGFLPLLHQKYTADVWDVLAYGVGAAIFHLSINKPLIHSSKKKV